MKSRSDARDFTDQDGPTELVTSSGDSRADKRFAAVRSLQGDEVFTWGHKEHGRNPVPNGPASTSTTL
ncbi:hypothetical protein ACIQ9R_15050 [Streptomyces sp. NPDC094447]|uniref:hypothetical protein n=1 Tax=Streptomyces sp. NPDC094447 TaxID=3366062 RepID=UPI00380F975C